MEAEGRGPGTFWLFSLREALGRCESSPGQLGGGICRGQGDSGDPFCRSRHLVRVATDVHGATAAEAPPGPGTDEVHFSARWANDVQGKDPPAERRQVGAARAEGKRRDEFLRVGAGGRRQRLRSQIGRL